MAWVGSKLSSHTYISYILQRQAHFPDTFTLLKGRISRKTSLPLCPRGASVPCKAPPSQVGEGYLERRLLPEGGKGLRE